MLLIEPSQVGEHLDARARRLGTVNFRLISQWDRWVHRRIEQIELISDAAARRRISVDFRLHRSHFGDPVESDGKEAVYYVPLTLLKKAPVSNFDLRDEGGAALPLLTKRKTSSICAATLSAATRAMIIEEVALHAPESEMGRAARTDTGFNIESIKLHPQLEADFLNLCVLPYERRRDGSPRPTAKDVHRWMMARTASDTLKADTLKPVSSWTWKETDEGWIADEEAYEKWVLGIIRDPDLSTLIFDLARLYMVATPIAAEVGRRRVIKLEYEEHYREPGLRVIGGVRSKYPRQTGWLRRLEDRAEGLSSDDGSIHEWLRPRTAMKPPPRQKLWEALAGGIGWRAKRIPFVLPGLGFGGTYHLEVTAPFGTQLRRAELQAIEPGVKTAVRAEHATRHAGNVTRAHLYLGGDHGGAHGEGQMYIKPKSSTVIRGAALAATTLWILVLIALLLVDGADEDSSRAPIAALLLVPGLLAAVAGQRFDHGITQKMVFGLRLLAMAVGGVAVVAAVLLGTETTFCDEPLLWSALLVSATALMGILLGAWRLAGRDWPRRLTS